MSLPTIGVYGAFGCGNVGDDLIAVVLQKYLKSQLPDRVSVEMIGQGKLETAINNIDILIIGGGGLIYDYDISNVRNYCNAIHKANAFRVPVYMLGIGVQHIFSDEARGLYSSALPIVKRIVTRGREDARQIRHLLSDSSHHPIISRDIAFLYEDVYQFPQRAAASNDKPRLVLSLSDWKLGRNYNKIKPGLSDEYRSYRQYLRASLPKLKDEFVVTVVCQAKEDIEISEEIAKLSGGQVVHINGTDDVCRFMDLVHESDIMISNRYHGFIAAVVAGTPVVSVAFDGHKTKRLIDESFPSQRPQHYSIGDFVEKDIMCEIRQADFRESLTPASRREYEACRALARKNAEAIKLMVTDIDKLYGGVI